LSQIGFVFRSHPHSSSKGREGLDALLAASAYSEDIAVFFIGEGVTQLITGQQAEQIYSRNYSPAFKLMELYDIEQVYICRSSLEKQGVAKLPLLLEAEQLSQQQLTEKLQGCQKVLMF